MVDILHEMRGGSMIRVSNHGLSMVRFSYQYDIDTENKERIFRQILSENRVSAGNGNLFLDVPC
jgi:hypothetical protein